MNNELRPSHYGGEENPHEPIKVIEHYNLNFNLGNALKYILRADRKGVKVEDLKKAITYLQFELRKEEKVQIKTPIGAFEKAIEDREKSSEVRPPQRFA